MKFGPVTKSEKWNKTTLKKFDNDVILPNCDVVIFPIYSQFGAIQKSDSGRTVSKTYNFINSTLTLQNLKTELKNL